MPMVTTPQAAEIIGMAQRTVQWLVSVGKLRAIRVSERNIMLIDLDDLRLTCANEGYTFSEEIAAQFATKTE